MSLKSKKRILIDWFRHNGGIPKAALSIDSDTAPVGNVFVNGTWYGTFDYCKREFLTTSE